MTFTYAKPMKIAQIHNVEVSQIHNVSIAQVHEIELPQTKEIKIPIIEKVELDTITPVRVAQRQPAKVATVSVPQRVIEPVVVVDRREYIPSIDTETVVYEQVIEEQCAPEIVEEVRYRTIPREVVRREIVRPAPGNYVIDERWREVLSNEEIIANQLLQMYDNDSDMLKVIQEAENEIKQSAEKYEKAKANIDSTIKESEHTMLEYEQVRLYCLIV